jgi:hypothetical protein
LLVFSIEFDLQILLPTLLLFPNQSLPCNLFTTCMIVILTKLIKPFLIHKWHSIGGTNSYFNNITCIEVLDNSLKYPRSILFELDKTL